VTEEKTGIGRIRLGFDRCLSQEPYNRAAALMIGRHEQQNVLMVVVLGVMAERYLSGRSEGRLQKRYQGDFRSFTGDGILGHGAVGEFEDHEMGETGDSHDAFQVATLGPALCRIVEDRQGEFRVVVGILGELWIERHNGHLVVKGVAAADGPIASDTGRVGR
jgi:hypothetical protein